MVQSLCNFTRNALEMPTTPITNAIVELNYKKKSFPLDVIGTVVKIEDFFLLLSLTGGFCFMDLFVPACKKGHGTLIESYGTNTKAFQAGWIKK